MVCNGTLSWGSGYCIADKIEWEVKVTKWLNKIESQKLCLKSATYTFPDAVLSSILITAGNSPVIWTQSSEMLHTTCLVDVSGGWPMVFHSLCEMRVMSEAVFTCKQTGWLLSFTDTFFRFDLELGKKVATKLRVFLFSLHLLWGCLFVVLCTGGVQNLSLCPCWFYSWQQCVLNGHFLAKCQPAQFQQADGGFFGVELGDIEYCCPWMVLIVGVVLGTDCCTISESCFRFTNCWHSSAACCRAMFGFCSIFDRILLWSSLYLAQLNQQTKIKHLNCLSLMDEILNHSHSLLTMPAHVVKSIVSHFVIFRQLDLALKTEVHSLKICFKVSTVSVKLQSRGCLGRM